MAFGFSLSHKTKDIKQDWGKLTNSATDTFNAGNALVSGEVNTLRGYSADYKSRLNNPLGTGPNSAAGIFSRARGTASDIATRSTGAFSSRLSQAQLQSNLSPEARAQLQEQNAREVNQNLFESNKAISDSEAAMTLSETSKLFDRMEGISKTILGVGTDQRTLGLNALIASITGRQALAFGKVAAATAMVGTAVGAATNWASGGASGAASGITGQH